MMSWGRRLLSTPCRATIAVLVVACGLPCAQAMEVELATQTVVTLASDHEMRGGGAGLGVEVGLPVLRDLWQPGSRLLARLRLTDLVGAGMVWGADLGLAWRSRAFGTWQPELGVHVATLGGDLIRTVDRQGHLGSNPVAAGLAVSLLRFSLENQWFAFLALRAGRPLFHDGDPPFIVSVTVFEVGRTFGEHHPGPERLRE
jgi:hypothetical protein